jgi:adenylyltransferase/sulfurtransferase
MGFSDSDRYASLRLIRWWDQERLGRATAVVAGLGALGNEVAKNLALLGVGRLVLVDLDTVEHANLARSVLFRAHDRGRPKVEAAAEQLARINPEISLLPIHGDLRAVLGLGLLYDADVVLGCLDNREARLTLNHACWKVGTPWIDGAIQEMAGTMKVFVPPDGTCYECSFTDEDYRLMNLRYSCRGLAVRDMIAGRVPTTPTIASIIGGMQAQEGVKLLHGLEVAVSKAVVYTGLSHFFYVTDLPRRRDCLAHETLPTPEEFEGSAADTTVEDLLNRAAGPDQPAHLVLPRDFVHAFRCDPCGNTAEVNRLRGLLHEEDGRCPDCGGDRWPETIRTIDRESPLRSRKLTNLGVPPYDIVTVKTPDKTKAFLLTGDRKALYGDRT